ncbi:MAG: hypothetical protein M3154_02995, partial [Candidatus Eremiobacteraeota bacterium]|nr:hypothetical protein [Candidatus Eremiobacteraeota bacterium]
MSAHEILPLDAGWEIARVPNLADSSDTAGLPNAGDALTWYPATVPGTVAGALRDAGVWDGEQPLDLDADAWWFRCRFAGPAMPDASTRAVLCLDGVATHARAWLNGVPIAHSASMFEAHAVDVSALLAASNDLVLRCDPLRVALDARRGRPRWRTRLTAHQQLRWERTTLHGRIPGWIPAAPVGPWRPVRIELRRVVDVRNASVLASLDGDDGVVEVTIALDGPTHAIRAATLVVGDTHGVLAVVCDETGHTTLRGTLRCPAVDRWWPHTHGVPARYAVCVELEIEADRDIPEDVLD